MQFLSLKVYLNIFVLILAILHNSEIWTQFKVDETSYITAYNIFNKDLFHITKLLIAFRAAILLRGLRYPLPCGKSIYSTWAKKKIRKS